jgi:hypothetical protein
MAEAEPATVAMAEAVTAAVVTAEAVPATAAMAEAVPATAAIAEAAPATVVMAAAATAPATAATAATAEATPARAPAQAPATAPATATEAAVATAEETTNPSDERHPPAWRPKPRPPRPTSHQQNRSGQKTSFPSAPQRFNSASFPTRGIIHSSPHLDHPLLYHQKNLLPGYSPFFARTPGETSKSRQNPALRAEPETRQTY